MKLYISALLLSMAQAQTGLRERWEMDNAVINYDSDSVFTLRFETASEDNYDTGLVTTFWDKRCKDTPNGINKELGAGLVLDPDENPPKLKMVTVDTKSRPQLRFKVDTLLMVATSTDAQYSGERPYTQTGGRGVLEFCVRNGLGFTSNPAPANTMYTNSYQEVNYIETLVTIEYNLAAGFTVDGFEVAPKDKVGTTQTAQYDEALEAYLCTGPQDPLYVPADHANYDLNDGVWIPSHTTKGKPGYGDPFNQGSLINVCLAIKAEFITQGVRIKTVNSFDFERLDNNFDKVESPVAQIQGGDVTAAGSLFQNAISAGSASANYLTSFQPSQCANAIACDFASVLFAEFYATAGTVIGNGKATLRFLSNADDAPYKGADNHQECNLGGYESILTEADCKAAKEYMAATSTDNEVDYVFTKADSGTFFGCESEDNKNDNIMQIMWYPGASTPDQILSQGQTDGDYVFCKRVDGDAGRRLGEGTVESRRLQDDAGQISAVLSFPVNGDVEGPGDLKTAGSATLGATVLASVAAVVGAIVLA